MEIALLGTDAWFAPDPCHVEWRVAEATQYCPRLDAKSFLSRDFEVVEISPLADGWTLTEPQLKAVHAAIVESRAMLELKDDWDDEGSLGYDEATWLKAASLVARLAHALWSDKLLVLDVPTIGPGPQGSIDIHWVSASYELAINIPRGTPRASFYGDDRAGLFIKGTLDSSAGNKGLLEWLVSRR